MEDKVKIRPSRYVSNIWGNKNFFFGDPEFNALVQSVETAIDQGINPKLIPQGSSGSYFAYNTNFEVVGVFKPKDEEPFAENNPKWQKWFQRNFSPCCFGRSCLLPNFGYLSEVGASLVDEKLGFNVVPKTRIVNLTSSNFSYSKSLRKIVKRAGKSLPVKMGSMQTFKNNFHDSSYWLRIWENKGTAAIHPDVRHKFVIEFQKMVILDYMIRNTDRHNSNWLIKYDPGLDPQNTAIEIPTSARSYSPPPDDEEADLSGKSSHTHTDPYNHLEKQDNQQSSHQAFPQQSFAKETDSSWFRRDFTSTKMENPIKNSSVDNAGPYRSPSVEIAVIDNGLAFPHKHPDSWRMYPFYWSYLSYAKIPFDESLATELELKLRSPLFVEDMCFQLRDLFKTDGNFKKRIFRQQMAVLRGQILNLRRAFSERASPADLVRYPRCLVYRKRLKFFDRRRTPKGTVKQETAQRKASLSPARAASVSSQTLSSHWSLVSNPSRLQIPENARWEDVYRRRNVAAEPKLSRW